MIYHCRFWKITREKLACFKGIKKKEIWLKKHTNRNVLKEIELVLTILSQACYESRYISCECFGLHQLIFAIETILIS